MKPVINLDEHLIRIKTKHVALTTFFQNILHLFTILNNVFVTRTDVCNCLHLLINTSKIIPYRYLFKKGIH